MAIDDMRRLRWAPSLGIALLSAGALAVGGCGGDDAPEGAASSPASTLSTTTAKGCGGLEDVSADVDELQAVDLESGEAAIADIEASLDAIRADLETAKSEAEADFAEPIAALETSLDGLSTELDAAKADDDLSADEAEGLLDSLAAVSTSWAALADAAEDCDL